MKNLLLSFIIFLLSVSSYSQVTVLNETFENLPLSMTASGSANWGRSNTFAATGQYSDSARIFTAGDSAILTSPGFSTLGYQNIVLQFDQICKLPYGDAGYVEISIDNGVSWTAMPISSYSGGGAYSAFTYFNALTYPIWDASNNNTIPTANWWKHEEFNLSSIAANQSNVKIRFRLKDIDNFGSFGNYGWLLDNIKVVKALSELTPPTILVPNPLTDSVFTTGPYEIKALITDSSSISDAYIVYTHNGISDTVTMTTSIINLYEGMIPAFQFDSSFCYKIVAIDNSVSHNMSQYPGTGCSMIRVVRQPLTKSIGIGTSGINYAPIHIDNSATTKYSNHISLFTSSELGFSGTLKSLSWTKIAGNNFSGAGNVLRIYLKHTSIASVPTTFASELSGATLVFVDSNFVIPNSPDVIKINFNKSYFQYVSGNNLEVLVEWYHPTAATANVSWQYTPKANQAITFYGANPNPTTIQGTNYNYRPNIVLFYDTLQKNYDAGIFKIINPLTTSFSSGTTDFKVSVKNFGLQNINKVQLNWSVDSVLQTPYIYNGNIITNLSSNAITIGTKNLQSGLHKFVVWTSLPNDSIDQNKFNDSASISFYACTQALSGSYTLGSSPSADFHSFNEVTSIIQNCGVVGPTVINVLPGVYNEQINLTSIPGLDSIKTITFQSSTGNANDVQVQFATSSSGNFIVKVSNSSYISFKNITFRNTSGSYMNCLTINSNSSNLKFIKCNFYGKQLSSNDFCINISGKNDNLTFDGNYIEGGYYGFYDNGTSTSRSINHIFINNTITKAYRTLLYLSYLSSSNISNNNIHGGHPVSGLSNAYIGIGMYYCTDLKIEKNKVNIYEQGPAYGVMFDGCNATPTASNKLYNNFINVYGITPNTSQYALMIQGTTSSLEVINNSIRMNDPGVVNNAVLIWSLSNGAGDYTFYNNIISNPGGGNGLYVYSSSASYMITSKFDNNLYYSNGGACVNWGGTAFSLYQGVSALTALSQKDSNSYFGDPKFYSANDLHSFSTLANNHGKVIPTVTDDIDFQTRSLTTPDIGADEFSISSLDAGIFEILSPLPIDTQNKVVQLKAIVRNYGSAALTNIDAKYILNGGSPVSATWTGNLAVGASDTINFGNFTIPGLNYTLKVFTTLTGDTLKYNDTIIGNYFGNPIINVEPTALISPKDGCDKANENIKIRIKNTGAGTLTNGLTASYKTNGMTTFVTENVPGMLAAGDSIDFTFANPVNMFAGMSDTNFYFTIAVNHSADLVHTNDTLTATILSLGKIPAPITNDTTINYGTSASLLATAANPVQWYNSATSTTIIGNSNYYTTPLLFDTTTYYVQANAGSVSANVQIGNGTTGLGNYSYISPYSPNGNTNSRQQYLFLASELQSMGLTAGNINSVSFYLDAVFNTNQTGWELKIGTTSQNASSSTFFTGATTVLSGTITVNSGWNEHIFNTPFSWDGVSNIFLDICAPASMTLSNSVTYTPTSFNSVAYYSNIGGGCSSLTGTTSTNRPNVKFKMTGKLGCKSDKVSAQVNVIIPSKDVKLDAIVEPVSGCGISTTPVKFRIINKGLDTIPGGYTATYKINSGSYITPVTINTTLAPKDTLIYTFPGTISLPTGSAGTKYLIAGKISVSGDLYSPNDTLTADSVFSKYTPTTPVVQNITVPYGQQTTLTATATDTVFWYSDPLLQNLLGTGSPFNAGAIFDTTDFYTTAQKTFAVTNYTIGNALNANSSNVGPSPYGAKQKGSKQQYLIRASELRNLGVQKGKINSIAFYVQGVKGGIYENYSISFGSTTNDSLTDFITNTTPVFNQITYTDIVGWNTHNLINPYYWDGTSNLVVQTCFSGSTAINGYAQCLYDSLNYKASVYAEGITAGCNSVTNDNMSVLRPQMRINAIAYWDCASPASSMKVSVSSFPNVDAGLVKFVSPDGNLSGNASGDVKVILKNYGLNTLTAANIQWKENGISKPSYNWTGSLTHGGVDTVTLASNYIFQGGPTTLQANVVLSGDAFQANDSVLTTFKVCMHDTFRIGATRRFINFQSALSALQSCGICGPVVFLADSGSYTEQLLFGSIAGSSLQNTITFESAAADSSKVMVNYSPSTATANYVIGLKNASNIIFSKISFSASSTQYAIVFNLSGTTNNIIIKNCVISTASTSYSSNDQAYNVYGSGTTLSNIRILNNAIKNGKNSIYFDNNTGPRNTKIYINGNTITGFAAAGIYLYYVDSTECNGNTIISSLNEPYYYAIRWMNSGVFTAANNRITLYPSNYGYGIYPWSTSGTATNPIRIYNNSIVFLNGNSTNYGILSESCSYLETYYNSISLVYGSNTSVALRFQNGTGIKVQNNNLYNANGYTIYANNPAALSVCDNNNYYSSPSNATNFAFWSSAKANFAALQAADPSKNLNSMSVNPMFYGSNNLHVHNSQLNAKAVPVSGIISDIEGNVRNASTPDIGAYEFTPANNDIGVTQILNPVISNCGLGNDSIVVRLFNFGLNPINFATNNLTINVNITGQTTALVSKVINSGTLAQAAYMDVIITSSFNFSQVGKYIINATTVWSPDGNSNNNNAPQIEITNYPYINTFPYFEGFESGNNITFKETKGIESNIAVGNSAAHTGNFGLNMFGGVYNGWGTHSNVTQAFANYTHMANAYTCQINSTGIPYLSLRLDLKQLTSSFSSGSNSWFRVMITDQNNNTSYLKNSYGDSVFTPLTLNSDPFTTHTFNLNAYAGSIFTISLQAANCYAPGISGTGGDNVFIDNFSIYVPSTKDVVGSAILNLNPSCGKIGQQKNFSFVVQNIGTDTLDTIPVAYRVNNGTIYRDTLYSLLAPNEVDTLSFTQSFTIQSGVQTIYAFTEIPGDANIQNDTAKLVFKGLNSFTTNYFDNFDTQNDWYATGHYTQWELGTPTTSTIATAYSTPNSWVTKLNGNYIANATEYLYSPFITIPVSTDTAEMEFWMNMDVISTKAYGRLQYSFDYGTTWWNAGYIGDPATTNWYNTNIGGLHAWSANTGGWIKVSMLLDPATFNTGTEFFVRFVFKTEPNGVTEDGWAIDNFKISIKQPALDMGVTQINTPLSQFIVGDSVAIAVKIKNFGTDTLTQVPVGFSVNNQVKANENWIGTLYPGQDTDYIFIQKHLVTPTDSKLCAYTKHGSDVIKANDTSCINLTILPAAIDAAIDQIIAPIVIASTITQNAVKVKIKNNGSNTLTSIPLQYKKGNVVISTDTFVGNLLPGQTVDYTFNTTFIASLGSFQLCAYTLLATDAYLANDVLCTTIIGNSIEDEIESGFYIEQNIPNPTNGLTTFEYHLPAAGEVIFEIKDLLGKTVFTEIQTGNSDQNLIIMDLNSLKSGIYFYSVEFNNVKRIKKLTVVK